MPELAYVNGEFLPIDQAVVPVEDRGYQLGDAVYEFIASYAGRMFRMEEHLDRLMRSMQELAFPTVPRERIRAALEELFTRAGIARAGIYMQLSRGVAPRNQAFPQNPSVQFVMTIRPVGEVPPAKRAQGIAVITIRDLRWKRCDIKTVQLLPAVLGKQQALDAGADDAIFVSGGGVVREGTSSNIFIVAGGRLVTHPLDERILPGITRAALLEISRESGYAVEERYFRTEELYAADEAFLTGTVTEVLPIVTIDGRTIGGGRPGPVTESLFAGLRRKAGV